MESIHENAVHVKGRNIMWSIDIYPWNKGEKPTAISIHPSPDWLLCTRRHVIRGVSNKWHNWKLWNTTLINMKEQFMFSSWILFENSASKNAILSCIFFNEILLDFYRILSTISRTRRTIIVYLPVLTQMSIKRFSRLFLLFHKINVIVLNRQGF